MFLSVIFLDYLGLDCACGLPTLGNQCHVADLPLFSLFIQSFQKGSFVAACFLLTSGGPCVCFYYSTIHCEADISNISLHPQQNSLPSQEVAADLSSENEAHGNSLVNDVREGFSRLTLHLCADLVDRRYVKKCQIVTADISHNQTRCSRATPPGPGKVL